MKTLGIFEAKTRLSEVIAEVAGGQVYLITKKGRPVAEIRPVSEVHDGARSAANALRRLATELAAAHGSVSPARVRSMMDSGRRLR